MPHITEKKRRAAEKPVLYKMAGATETLGQKAKSDSECLGNTIMKPKASIFKLLQSKAWQGSKTLEWDSS